MGNSTQLSKYLLRGRDQMLRAFPPATLRNSTLEGSAAFRPGCFTEYKMLSYLKLRMGSDGNYAF